MSLSSQIMSIDMGRRRKYIRIAVNFTGNYVPGGDKLDLTLSTNPGFLQGGNFGAVPGEGAAENDPGGYSCEYQASRGGARSYLAAAAFTNGGAGTALSFTLTPPATLGGTILINSAGGTAAGTQLVDLSQYALGSSNQLAATAAAAALTAFLNSTLKTVTGSTYTVAANATTGVVTITPSGGGSAGETLTVTASRAAQWVTSTTNFAQLANCAIVVFSANGTELAAGAYPAAIKGDTLYLRLSMKMYKGM